MPAALGSDALGSAVVLARRDVAVIALDPVSGADLTVQAGVGTTDVRLVGLAVQNPGSTLEADLRIERFTTINTAVAESTGPVVVTGNLETSRWSQAHDEISSGLTNSEDGFGYAATWPPARGRTAHRAALQHPAVRRCRSRDVAPGWYQPPG